MKLTICRMVGNELTPSDSLGSKLDCLKWLVDTDRSPLVRTVYVVNHIVDPHYESQVLDVLRDEEFIEFPFDIFRFRHNVTGQAARLHYALSTNEGRNFGIRYCQQFSDFIACLDQDCYFREEDIPHIISRIEQDQEVSERRRQYYGVVTKRVHNSHIPRDLNTLTDSEPMVIVRSDVDKLFDPMLAYGQRDKLALLEHLGYVVNRHGVQHHGDKARTVGACLQVAFGPQTNYSEARCTELRTESLTRLMTRIEELYPVVHSTGGRNR